MVVPSPTNWCLDSRLSRKAKSKKIHTKESVLKLKTREVDVEVIQTGAVDRLPQAEEAGKTLMLKKVISHRFDDDEFVKRG